MSNQKYYTVIAGRRDPEDVEMGFLDKTTGLPKGTTQKVKVAVGAIMLPNYSRVWARRVSTNLKATNVVSVMDKDYKGKLEFLTWGDDRGELVEIRFIPQSQSLDKQYQEQVLKLKPGDDDVFIVLNQGVNDFDPATEEGKISMIKHHTMNRDNESRDPNNTEFDYIEYSIQSSKTSIKQIEIRREAETIVLDAKEDENALKVLCAIFNLEERMQDDRLEDVLMSKVQEDPHKFLSIIQNYKVSVHELMSTLAEEELLVLTSDNRIDIVVDGKKRPLFDDVAEEDPNKKIMWVINNILNPDVFEGIKDMEETKKKLLATSQLS